MKEGIGVGGLILIGLLVWWLLKGQKTEAAPLLRGETYLTESEYEKLHRVVPITAKEEKEIQVYTSFEEYEEAVHG